MKFTSIIQDGKIIFDRCCENCAVGLGKPNRKWISTLGEQGRRCKAKRRKRLVFNVRREGCARWQAREAL